MKNINCRSVEICIFCKHWQGEKPQVDYRTGECKIPSATGQCALDKTGQYYKADNLCSRFNKSIVYM